MAVSSISCSLRPPAPFRESSARLTQPLPPKTTTTPWAERLRRACVAAAAVSCVVIGTAGGGDVAAAAVSCVVIGTAGGGDVAAASMPRDTAVLAVDARPAAAPRWSDRRECPPWRANSLENIVPENLPRPSARRRFNTVKRAPRTLGPQAVAPFLALPNGVDDCFTL